MTKAALRKKIKSATKLLLPTHVTEASRAVSANLFNLPSYINSNSISIYLSMKGEIDTETLVHEAMENNRRVFIPKITGKNCDDMFMLEVSSKQHLNSFTRDSWGIPDPPTYLIEASIDGACNGQIHCVIVPGVAFDSKCGRLGHGKGYYDNFLTRLFDENDKLGLPRPVTIGLAMDEQMVESVPMEPHDRYLDFIVTPSKIYSRISH